MAFKHRIVQPGYRRGTVKADNGEMITPPEDWSFLPAGDAPLTRLVKSRCVTWVVQVQRGRRKISKGIYADTQQINRAKRELEAKRSTAEYAHQRERELARKNKKQQQYVVEFHNAVVASLNFHARYAEEAEQLARLIASHATPVGSGTVARTKKIPLAERADSAIIAWLRHKTTSYDSMKIARIKGRRREVRRELAGRSIALLNAYREGRQVSTSCPLQLALSRSNGENT